MLRGVLLWRRCSVPKLSTAHAARTGKRHCRLSQKGGGQEPTNCIEKASRLPHRYYPFNELYEVVGQGQVFWDFGIARIGVSVPQVIRLVFLVWHPMILPMVQRHAIFTHPLVGALVGKAA